MSTSKFIMAQKLQRVQIALMEEEISSTQLHILLPIVFKKCLKENITFWFNFLEDSCVLNLRDVEHENMELNIRYAYSDVPSEAKMEVYKEMLLINAFLITRSSEKINEIASSATTKKQKTRKDETRNKPIQESNLVPPSAIKVAIELCEKNNEEITKKNIEKKLDLGQMSQDKKRRCIAYLRSMGA